MIKNYPNYQFILVLVLIIKIVLITKIDVQNVTNCEDHWNVSEWWAQNTDFDHKSSDLKFENLRQQSQDLKIESSETSGLWTTVPESLDLIYSLESNDDKRLVIPKSSVQSIEDTIYNYFTRVRSYRGDRTHYRKIKRNLKEKFLELGLLTALQSFWPSELRKYSTRDKAHNIIGIWPGSKRGTTADKIIIIGAHYDTVRLSPGVDDNGSGCAAVLEIAKLITQNNCKFDKTLMFVLFDMEEDGLKGSKHFVKDYLIPIELNKNSAQVSAVIIMDMILEHDMSRNSQSLGIIANVLPEWSSKVRQNGYRGDFAAVWARKGVDTKLFEKLEKNWLNKDKYKLLLMAPALPELGAQLERSGDAIKKYETFVRSDHASFWYPTPRSITFPAILITDLGPWRRNMKYNYHKSSDDTRSLNKANLLFVKNTIDSVVNTVLDLAKGKCFQ